MLKKILLSSFLILPEILDASATPAILNQEVQSTSAPFAITSSTSESSTSASKASENTFELALRCSEPLSTEAWSKIVTRLPQIGLDPTTIDPQKIHILSASAIINGIFAENEDKKTHYLDLLEEESIEILKEEIKKFVESLIISIGFAKDNEAEEINKKLSDY